MYSAARPHVEKKIQTSIIPHVQYSISMVPTAIFNGQHRALDLYDSILCSEISFASDTSVNDDELHCCRLSHYDGPASIPCRVFIITTALRLLSVDVLLKELDVASS